MQQYNIRFYLLNKSDLISKKMQNKKVINFKKTNSFFGLMIALVFLISCEKGAGIGGTSDLIGKIKIEEYNQSGQLVQTYEAQEERVYIIYGRNEIYDDDTRTHFDGSYQFKNLNEGNYTIFAYSGCDTCSSGKKPVSVSVDISARKSTVEAPEIVLFDYQ